MNPDWFKTRLKELREGAGMSQQALADKAGLKLGGIRDLEQGRNFPTWPTVLALAEALGVTCEAFNEPPADREPSGRGRPPKKDEPQEAKPKRGRGRPKKDS